MTKTSAKIVADSISPAGHRLTTFEAVFPRIVLAEFNTHRMLWGREGGDYPEFSRNSASSRAIPVEKMIKMVENDPYIPTHWGKNQKGMQAEVELSEAEQVVCRRHWEFARDQAVVNAKMLLDVGVHKQITNRLLEPFMWHTVIVTATEWENFYHLRRNAMAHPEIKLAADVMHDAMERSTPTALSYGEWHTPLCPELREVGPAPQQPHDWWCKVSVGRSARVSYLTHDGKRDPQADIDLANRLLEAGHMSPFEHVARPMTPVELELFKQKKMRWDPETEKWFWVGSREVYHEEDNTVTVEPGEYTHFLGNMQGWVQYRKMIPYEEDILGARS